MTSVLVPLAQDCEELEAVTIIDILRRARINVTSAGLEHDLGPVRASRCTMLIPDTTLDKALELDYDMIVLPGGLPGANHLMNDARIIQCIQDMAAADKYVAAICAAPRALAHAGILNGKRATSYPGTLDKMDVPGMTYCTDPVVIDGKIITSRGPGTAMEFALTLVEVLEGKALRDETEAPLLRP